MITRIARHRSAHRAFCQSVNAKLTVPRRVLIDRGELLSIRRQCVLLGVARSGLYRAPRPANDNDLLRYRAGNPWRDLPERFGDWRRLSRAVAPTCPGFPGSNLLYAPTDRRAVQIGSCVSLVQS